MTKPRKSPKISKVEEPAAPYGVDSSPTAGADIAKIRYASAKDVEPTNKRLMQVHRETLRKLAK